MGLPSDEWLSIHYKQTGFKFGGHQRVILTYWEASEEVSELSYKSLLFDSSRRSYLYLCFAAVKRTIKDSNCFSINTIADIKNLENELKK